METKGWASEGDLHDHYKAPRDVCADTCLYALGYRAASDEQGVVK